MKIVEVILNCKYCGTQIQIGGAISFKPNPNHWKYVHICTQTSCIAECISEYRCEKSLKDFVSREFNPDAPNPRQCDKDGFCTYPFDRDVNTIMRTLGGRFNSRHPSGNKGWQMPVEIELRANIVSVLTSANFDIDPEFGNLDTAVMGDIEKQRKEHLEWAVSKGLYEFQVQGVDWLLRNKRCLLRRYGLRQNCPEPLCYRERWSRSCDYHCSIFSEIELVERVQGVAI